MPRPRKKLPHNVDTDGRLCLSRSELAERLGISTRTLDRHVAAGRIRRAGDRRKAMFPVTEIERFLSVEADQ